MIALVRGILVEKGPESAVVDCGGLGYEVFLTAPSLAQLPAPGEEVRFFTHFHVREDAQVLYGFPRSEERAVFLLLMTVKGVGPKVALGILSNLGASDLVGALIRRDTAALTRLPGVGKKLAERLGVELSDKARELGLHPGEGLPQGRKGPDFASGLPGAWPQAMAALQSLGYAPAQARQACELAYKMLGPGEKSLEDMVKAALKSV